MSFTGSPFKLQGYKAQIGYSTTSGGTPTIFATTTKWEVNVKGDVLDASDHNTASSGWKAKMLGLKEWTASLDGMYLEDGIAAGDAEALFGALTGATLLYFTFYPQETASSGQLSYVGSGYITGFKHSAGNNDVQNNTYSIEGFSPLTVAAQ